MQKRNQGSQEPPQPSQACRFDRRLMSSLDADQMQEFARAFKSCGPVREAVIRVLTKELDGAILQSESRDRLMGPNALADLTDLQGYRRGLRQAIKLLTDKETSDD